MMERALVVGPFQANCYIVACEDTGHAAIIDPGDDAKKIVAEFSSLTTKGGAKLTLKYLLHTHGHVDHVGATRAVYEAFPNEKPEIMIHQEDEPLYRELKMQGRIFGITYDNPLPVTRFLKDGDEIALGNLRISVMLTGGHSPGSVSLKIGDTLYSGDTLFQGGVGRTDLWGGDQELMFKNIREKILILSDQTRVCPGHGPETTVGEEKRTNPFLT